MMKGTGAWTYSTVGSPSPPLGGCSAGEGCKSGCLHLRGLRQGISLGNYAWRLFQVRWSKKGHMQELSLSSEKCIGPGQKEDGQARL